MTKIRRHFPKIRTLSFNFQESAGETSPSPPSSYASVVIRKYRLPLITKFVIVKLEIDFFSVSMIVIKSDINKRWKVSVNCFVEHSLHSPPFRKCVNQLSRLSLGRWNLKPMPTVFSWFSFQWISSFFHLVPWA